jgi:hypothetical protein
LTTFSSGVLNASGSTLLTRIDTVDTTGDVITLPTTITTIGTVKGGANAATLGAGSTLTIASGSTLTIGGSASLISTGTSGITLAAGTYTATGGAVGLTKAGVLSVAGTLTGVPAIATGTNDLTNVTLPVLQKIIGGSVTYEAANTTFGTSATISTDVDLGTGTLGHTDSITLTFAGGKTITTSGITTIGDLILAGNGGLVPTNAANVFTTSKTLVVGADNTVLVGTNLTFGPGAYTAGGDASIKLNGSTGAISPTGNADEYLELGTTGTKLKLWSLNGGGTYGTATFTATGAVRLSGVGSGAIIATGAFTLGATAEIAIGDGTIALGNGGSIASGDGALITGFTDTSSSSIRTGAQTDASFKGAAPFAAYSTGITLPAGTATYASSGGKIALKAQVITSTADNGGVLTKASDVAS